jgi:hypothetical protein
LPEPANVNVDGAFFDEYMIAPDLIEQLPAGMHALAVGHQKMQQTELGRSEFERQFIPGDAVARRVQPQPIELCRLAAVLRRAAT